MSSFLDKLAQDALKSSSPKTEEKDFLSGLSELALGTTPVNAPGITSDIKRGFGQVTSAIGSTMQDIGAEDTGTALENYGEKVVRRNPSQINTLEEAVKSPFTTAREAVGEVVPQVGVSAAFGMGGRVIGGALGSLAGPVGTAVGQTVGAGIGAFAGNLIQEYGGIRQEQRRSGDNDIARALVAGAGAATLDTAFGAEALANKALGKGTSFLAREQGAKLLPHVAKQAGRGFAEEFVTEGFQTGIERWGGHQELTGDEALNEYGLSALKGGLGGGAVRGGMAAVAGHRKPEGSFIPGSNDDVNIAGTPDADGIKKALNIYGTQDVLNTQDAVNQAVGVKDQVTTAEHNARMADVKAAFDEPTGIRVTDPQTGLERELTAFEYNQLQTGGQSAEVAQNAQKTQEMNQARADAFSKFGGVSVQRTEGNSYSFLGKIYNTENELNAALDKVVMLEQAKPDLQKKVEAAYVKVNEMLGGKPVTPSNIITNTKNFWAEAKSLQDVIERLDIEIQHRLNTTKGEKALADLEKIHVLRDELAGVPPEQRVPTVDLLPKQEPKGVQNGQQQVQSNAGLRTVSEQGGAGQTSGERTGDVRPTSVQSERPTSVGERPLSLQVGEVPGVGVSTSTGTDVTGTNLANAGTQAQGSINGQPAEILPALQRNTGESGQRVSGATQGNVTSAAKGHSLTEAEINAAEDITYRTVLRDLLDLVITGRGLSAAEKAAGLLDKKRDFMAAVMGTPAEARENSLPKLAEEFGITLSQAKRYSADAANFHIKYATQIGKALKTIAAERRMTPEELLDKIVEVNLYNKSIQSEAQVAKVKGEAYAETQQTVLDERSFIADEDTGDQELSAKKGRKSESLQEYGNKNEGIGAKYLNKLEALMAEEAKPEEEQDQAKIAKLKEDLATEQAKLEKKPAPKTNKRKKVSNAVQKQSTDEGNVQEPAGSSKAVGEGNTKHEVTTGARKAESKGEVVSQAQQEVKGSDGNPLVVYHGTNKDFESFDEKTSKDKGVWFTPNRSATRMYGDKKVIAATVAMANPYEAKVGESKVDSIDNMSYGGHDGIIVRDEKGEVQSLMVAEASQIKVLSQAKQEVAAWNKLPVPIQYEQLSAQAKADWAIAVKEGKTNLAAANAVYEENFDNIQKQIADESRTIDGTDLIKETSAEKRRALLSDQTSKLTDAQLSRLEKFYGKLRDDKVFYDKLADDVISYINKGAEAVAGAIRDIIRQIANGVIAIAVVLNPQFMSAPNFVKVPVNTTEVVMAKVPTIVDTKMSKSAKQAFGVLMPALQKEMKEQNKYFTIVDKPTSTIFVFNPDGTLLDSSFVVLGKAMGDFYVGNTDLVKNRNTAAGLFKATAEKGSATYDGKTVYTYGNEAEGWNAVFMHRAYLKEGDAQLRRDALATGKNTNLSHGCVNGSNEFMDKLDEKKMDGSHVFIVPYDQTKVNDFIENKVSNEDLTRVTVKPVTKSAPGKTTVAMGGQSIFGKEEKGTYSVSEKADKGQDAEQLSKTLKKLFLTSQAAFDKLVTVVDRVEDLDQAIIDAMPKISDPTLFVKGFAYKGHVYLIANNINKTEALSVMLHELGAHVGMEKLIGQANYLRVTKQIMSWVQGKGNELENSIATKAYERWSDHTAAVDTTEKQRIDEMVAYFVEEAVLAGVKPTGLPTGNSTSIVAVLRTIIAGMKVALRKLGLGRFEDLTAGNIVDIAYGAAKLELDGTYHGTKADFRTFLDEKVGRVVNGWGHYTAEAKSEAAAYGQLMMRTLPMVDTSKLMEYYEPLGEQPQILSIINKGLPADVKSAISKFGALKDRTGQELYNLLMNYETTTGGLYAALPADAKTDVMSVREIVSKFLDSVVGVPGMTYPAARAFGTDNTIIFNQDKLARVTTTDQEGEINFSLGQKKLDQAREATQARINNMPPAYRNTAQKLFDFLTGKKLGDRLLATIGFTRDVAAIAATKGLKAAVKYKQLDDARKQVLGSYSSKVEGILESFNKLPEELKGTDKNSVNAFLKDSTMEGKWGFQPDWIKNKVAIDPLMEQRFKAFDLNPSAQAVIKEVFKFNYDVNQAMKKVVMENINTEFDALIADAKQAGKVDEVADLQKQKARSLSDYQTLLKVNSEKPYAALKRFGNIVIVAKSDEYLKAEDAKDYKTISKLESDEKHYVVRFFESNSEAQQAYRKMQADKYAYLSEPFDSADADKSVYGGRDVNAMFQRLRNLAVREGNDRADRGLNQLLNNLHLKLLSEQSARHSENRRRNVTGADDDMMRSFATQGKASAHFLSSLTNSGKIYEALQEMRKQRDERTPGKDVRAIYYNEIMARHGLDLAYNPSPVVDAALTVTSTWMLLTSPGYFLQNATQPFLLSMPYMAAKYGEGTVFSSMVKAYKDIKGVIGKTGVSESSYAKLPADIRSAIEELVNRGSINISLSQEIGRFRSSIGQTQDVLEKGGNIWAKATDFLRGAAENLESINRVATAVTAYRLAISEGKMTPAEAIDYADKVIYTTHGDYSGANAPRFMRTGAGRIATQFRKFQLIQISLLARMWNDWKQGENETVRAVAKKQLMYTLAHTFAVGGIMGMPGFAAIAGLVGALFGGDDEPENPELWLREAIGDPMLADLLVKGVPAGMGVDVSGKLGMGQMLSVLPYTDLKLTKQSYQQAALALMGGPFAGGLMPKAVDGLALLAAGDYVKGIETLMPKGISDAMKGYRLSTEGMTNKAGDVFLSPDEVNFLEGIMIGFGLPTTDITKTQFKRSVEFENKQFYAEKTTEMKHDYAKAAKDNDSAAKAAIQAEWMKIQEARVKNGLPRQPLSELLRSPMEQAKRERKLVGGVDKKLATRLQNI